MFVECVDTFHLLLVPDLDRAIGRARNEMYIVRREGDAEDPGTVSTQGSSYFGILSANRDPFESTRGQQWESERELWYLHVKYFDVTVVRACAEDLRVGREGQRPNGHGVAFE